MTLASHTLVVLNPSTDITQPPLLILRERFLTVLKRNPSKLFFPWAVFLFLCRSPQGLNCRPEDVCSHNPAQLISRTAESRRHVHIADGPSRIISCGHATEKFETANAGSKIASVQKLIH